MALGMHSSITFCFHLLHNSSMSVPLSRKYQSVASSRRFALSKSACEYIPPNSPFWIIDRERVSDPLQSNMDTIVIRVAQWWDCIASYISCEGFESSTRSMSVELPERFT